MTLDIIDSRIFKSSVIKAKRKVPKNICMIHFLKKFAEFINVSRNSAISFKIRKFIVAYQLNNSISFKIFNFNKFIHNLDVKVFFQDNSIMACGCQDSNFLDKDHQHVVTCDLGIIENNKLRKIFTKGRNIR